MNRGSKAADPGRVKPFPFLTRACVPLSSAFLSAPASHERLTFHSRTTSSPIIRPFLFGQYATHKMVAEHAGAGLPVLAAGVCLWFGEGGSSGLGRVCCWQLHRQVLPSICLCISLPTERTRVPNPPSLLENLAGSLSRRNLTQEYFGALKAHSRSGVWSPGEASPSATNLLACHQAPARNFPGISTDSCQKR